MVKFGKEYRKLQLDEWKKYYIDYKALKKKIKEIKIKIFGKRHQENEKKRNTRPSILSLPLLPEVQQDEEGNLSTLYKEKNGELLKEFIKLLLQEFKKSYNFFTGIEKVLIKKINTHLYTQTSYSTYGLVELSKEMKSLSLTVYLAKCLNAFINDIMMAVKKILKKFDKKFGCIFGLITPNLILNLLSKKNSELEYLLQFKIIDEVSTIAESSTYELKKYFDQNIEKSSKENDQFREEFLKKFNDTLEYIKSIDELIYFKTQYKDWLDYIRGIKSTKKNIKNLENDIFNPILSSSYYNDNLLDKFLSTKEAHKDVAMAQSPISKENKINVILIIAQTFFTSSLITCIFPLLYYYEYMNAFEIRCEENNCTVTMSDQFLIGIFVFIIVSLFYLAIFLSAFIFYNFCATKRIKLSYIISYIFSLLGSIIYAMSLLENQGHFKKRAFVIGLARTFIGLGINPMIGRKYLTVFAPKYNLPTISKIYLIFEILGMSFGPLFAALFTYIKIGRVFCVYNCIGWYGSIGSLILLILHILFFKQPTSGDFCIVQNQNVLDVNTSSTQISNQPFFEDVEDTQDKEFYKMQKEIDERKKKGLEPTKSDDVNIETNDNINTGITKTKSNFEKIDGTHSNIDAENVKQIIGEAGDVLGDNQMTENYYNNVDTGRYSNLELNEEEQRDTIKNIEAKLYEYQEKSNFTYINMMPRTIDDIILKEQKIFGYMNRNLMTMFLLMFWNNFIKENFIIFSSYFLLFNYNVDTYDLKTYEVNVNSDDSLTYANQHLNSLRLICCYVSIEIIFQLFSLLFILPFYKVNLIYKKNLIVYMILSIIFMIPISIPSINKIYIFIPFATLIIAVNKIIEITSSCYLVYLIPPQWKFMHLKAGRLPLYLMIIAKSLGCILCLTFFHPKGIYMNLYFIIAISLIAYGIIGMFIYKSENFRVKALSRVLRKRVIE